MQLLKIITARSIWLLPLGDMNPQGKAIGNELIEWLKKAYHFQKYPSSVFDLDNETKALMFLGGKFKSGLEDGKDRYLIVNLSIYNDGLVANTESSTKDSDKFLAEGIDSIAREFGLVHSEIRKKLYFSEMDIRLDRPMSLLNPKLEKLAVSISSLREDEKVPFEFSGVSFLPEPAAQTAISSFALERKINTDWAENRYYTRAPLQTHAHLKLLEDFESLLVS